MLHDQHPQVCFLFTKEITCHQYTSFTNYMEARAHNQQILKLTAMHKKNGWIHQKTEDSVTRPRHLHAESLSAEHASTQSCKLPILLHNLWFFKYKLPFFVLLCFFIGSFIFPSQHLMAITAINISNRMQSCDELPVFPWPNDYVHRMRKQKGSPVPSLRQFWVFMEYIQQHSPKAKAQTQFYWSIVYSNYITRN